MTTDSPVELGIPGIIDTVEIGRGGFAVVYRGYQPDFDRLVAVKVLDVRADQSAQSAFQRECRAIGRLSGRSHILTVHEAGIAGSGRPYLVMAYLSRGSLEDELTRSGPMPWADVVTIGTKVALGLGAAHQLGILHRDVKPANILMSDDGDPQLADFGIARLASATRHTLTGLAFTPAHAPPESWGGLTLSPAADIYSLASTLYHLLAGHPPFMKGPQDTFVEILARVISDPVPDLRPAGVPDAVCLAIERGLAKDPAARPPSAEAFAADLQAARELAEAEIERPTWSPDTKIGPIRESRERLLRIFFWTTATIVVLLTGLRLVSRIKPSGTASSAFLFREKTLFLDTFDDPNSGWEQQLDSAMNAEGAGDSAVIRDSRYRLTIGKPNFVKISDTRFPEPRFRPELAALGNVAVEVDAVDESSTGSAVFGLVCRENDGDAYVGVVGGHGFWGVYKASRQSFEALAKGEVSASADRTGKGKAVHIRMECVGGGGGSPARIRLHVDGALIADVKNAAPLRNGSVGLVAASEPTSAGVDVYFDSFVVKELRPVR